MWGSRWNVVAIGPCSKIQDTPRGHFTPAVAGKRRNKPLSGQRFTVRHVHFRHFLSTPVEFGETRTRVRRT